MTIGRGNREKRDLLVRHSAYIKLHEKHLKTGIEFYNTLIFMRIQFYTTSYIISTRLYCKKKKQDQFCLLEGRDDSFSNWAEKGENPKLIVPDHSWKRKRW